MYWNCVHLSAKDKLSSVLNWCLRKDFYSHLDFKSWIKIGGWIILFIKLFSLKKDDSLFWLLSIRTIPAVEPSGIIITSCGILCSQVFSFYHISECFWDHFLLKQLEVLISCASQHVDIYMEKLLPIYMGMFVEFKMKMFFLKIKILLMMFADGD